MNRVAYIILALFFLSNLFGQEKTIDKKVDSLDWYLSNAKNEKRYSLEERLDFTWKAKKLAEKYGTESDLLSCDILLSTIYWEQKNLDSFRYANEKALTKAKRLKDTSTLAKAYFLKGKYYRGYPLTDSAYYYYHKSEKLYKSLGDNFNTAIVLLSIAIVQKNEKDFIGSEVTSIESLSLLEDVRQTDEVRRVKAYLYNNLGMVFDQLEQFQESIEYHLKAFELKRTLDGDNLETIDNSKNNLARAYKNSGAYAIAASNYKEILDDKELKHRRPPFYALVLDNYAHTKFLMGDLMELPELYLKALRICDSIGETYNSIIINQHLAEFYNSKGKKDSARYYGYAAKDISLQYHNDDLLESILLLSKIEDDSLAVKHYKDYIALNDSLHQNERAVRNKFARIRYETREIEQKNKQISKEKSWLTILLVGVLLTFVLIYIIVSQRAKNRQLQFSQQQQEANEEIYNLMLSRQDKIDEARMLEKRRISEELHDGVLGRLFGTRLSLDSLNMVNSEEAIKNRGVYIEELKNIEHEIRKISHDLNTDFISGSGYLDIVDNLVSTQTAAYQLGYTLNHNDSIVWDEVSNKTKIHFYRIIQESLQNIYKHANASHVTIDFTLGQGVISLSIRDDGNGFDVNRARKGIGLKNINSRVSEIEGELQIDSTPSTGTIILVNVPI